MKIQSTKKSNFPENLPKYVYINFQIWFPKYKFKNSKYIKNVEVHSLRTPALNTFLFNKPSENNLMTTRHYRCLYSIPYSRAS